MNETENRTCRFIAGEKGRDFDAYGDPGVYCGAPCRRLGDGWSSFCAEHHARCHTKRIALPKVARAWI